MIARVLLPSDCCGNTIVTFDSTAPEPAHRIGLRYLRAPDGRTIDWVWWQCAACNRRQLKVIPNEFTFALIESGVPYRRWEWPTYECGDGPALCAADLRNLHDQLAALPDAAPAIS